MWHVYSKEYNQTVIPKSVDEILWNCDYNKQIVPIHKISYTERNEIRTCLVQTARPQQPWIVVFLLCLI